MRRSTHPYRPLTNNEETFMKAIAALGGKATNKEIDYLLDIRALMPRSWCKCVSDPLVKMELLNRNENQEKDTYALTKRGLTRIAMSGWDS